MTAAEMDIIIGANVDQAVAAMKKLGYEIKNTEKKTTDMAKKSGQAFTDFNRVIQDAPFGFIAIQNNLGPLIDSFKTMRAEAKEAGVSLGSVLKNALSGPAGLGLAISAITAAITFLQVGFTAWFRSSKDAKEGADSFATGLENVAKEAENVKITLEGLTAATDTMQKLWSAQNKVRFFGDDTEANLSDARNNIAFLIADVNDFAKAVDDAVLATEKASRAQADVINEFGAGSEEAKKAGEQYEKVVKIQFDLQEQQKKKADELRQARSQLALVELQVQQSLTDAAKKKADEAAKERERLLKELAATADLNKNIKGIDKRFLGAIAVETGDFLNAEIQKELDRQPPLQVANKQPELNEDTKKRLAEIGQLAGGIVQGGFEAIGETLGNLFSGQNNPFAVFFDFLGSTFIKLGAYVIAASELLADVTKVLTTALSGFGGAGIAVGIGLIALGTIIKNIPKFATGGVVTSPTLALIGEQGPERVVPLGFEGRANNNWMGGEVVFQISGQNLRGILRRADQTAFNTF